VSRIAAVVYLVATGGVVTFQLALALGAPWGSYAMGGIFPGRFPAAMRAAAIGQAVVLVLMAAVVLSRTGLVLPSWAAASKWLIWVVVAYGATGVGLNAITPSAGERRVWLPVALLMLACSLTVALTPR
jgi:hypothetical protein